MTGDATTLADAEKVVSRAGRRVVLATLRATQITSWGHLTGLLSAPLTITMAAAPFAGAALAEWFGSYATTFVLLGALATVAVALSFLTIPRTERATND